MANPSVAASASGSGGTSIGCSPSSAIAAGSTLWAVVACSGSGKTVSGLADTQGNTWTQVNTPATSHHTLYVFEATGITALGTGDTVTGTFSSSSNGDLYIYVILLPGYAGQDGTSGDASSSGSQTSLTVTSGALGYGTDMAMAVFAHTSTSGSMSLSSGWTRLVSDDSAGGIWLTVGYHASPPVGGAACTGTVSPATGIAGSIAAFVSATVSFPGTVSLSGSGTMTASWAYEGAASLSGSGTMTATGMAESVTGASLSGSGTMTAAAGATFERGAALSGSGTLSAVSTGFGSASLSGSGTMTAIQSAEYGAALSGTGTLGAGTFVLGYSAALTGTGTLAVAQVLGVVTAQAASGPATRPQAWPGSSQVAVSAPGSSQLYWLGTLGQVTALTYSYVCPGGADKMTCTVMVPASYRTQLFNPGWTVHVYRGGAVIWQGVMDEPVPTASGWNLTATGVGNLGANYLAIYTSPWPGGQPDTSINGAISRGLPWVNPGVGQPSWAWFGQAVDSGAQNITALLNLVMTRGGATWYVNSQPGGYPGNDLSVFPLPTVPDRLLVCTTPAPRTLGGDVNTIYLRYEMTPDTTGSSGNTTPATYGLAVVQNAQSVAMHGELEQYIDIADAGVLTQAQAQAVGSSVLQHYIRASFSGPFTVRYGELLNMGGQPIDPGTDQAATVCQLLLTDGAYGGEVTPGPIVFLVGSFSWDDMSQTATIQPYQYLDESISSMLSAANTTMVPVKAASGG